MGSYKRPRVFDPLDLEIIDLVYEAASAQLAARHPPSNPDEESVRQEALKKLVFACAQSGSRAVGRNADRRTFLFDRQGEGRRR